MTIRDYGTGVVVLHDHDRVWIASAANMRARIRRERVWRAAVVLALIPARNYAAAVRTARRLSGRFRGQRGAGKWAFRTTPEMLRVIQRYARFVNGVRDREIGGGERRRLAQLARRGVAKDSHETGQFSS